MDLQSIISEEVKKLLAEVYTPGTETRNIVSNEVTDEEVEKAEEILSRGVDPSWDVSQWGCMIIGVTGRHQVYYTFWKYNPRGETYYMGNLATDIIRAAEKARKIAGKQPVYFEQYETLKGLLGAPADVVGFGKYRGRTLGEVYAENPQYVIWISKNFTARNAKQEEFRKIAQEFTDTYFRSMSDANRAVDTKGYYGKPGEKINVAAKIIKIDAYKSEPDGYTDYGNDISYRVRLETDNERFQFYSTPKGMSKLTGVEYKASYIRGSYGVYSITSPETKEEIANAIPALINTDVTVKGTIKTHKEIVGNKYTILSRVTFQ